MWPFSRKPSRPSAQRLTEPRLPPGEGKARSVSLPPRRSIGNGYDEEERRLERSAPSRASSLSREEREEERRARPYGADDDKEHDSPEEDPSGPLVMVKPATAATGGASGQTNGFDPSSFSGQVLSLEEPAYHLSERQRRHAALLSQDGVGILLINQEDVYNPAVMQLRETARLRNFRIAREYEVPLEVIRNVYIAREQTLGKQGRRTSIPVQERFLALLQDAAYRRASDIHMMVGRFEATIKFRIDGVLVQYRTLPAEEAHAICVAAFNLAEASDANYRPLEYQGARLSKLRVNLPPEVMSVRLQFNPMLQGGRYMVARLLYEETSAAVGRTFPEMGFLRLHERDFTRMRRRAYGVNILSGPTGSGKSTTLKRCLETLHEERGGRSSILTIEDPPEYAIKGAAQFPVLNATSDEERREKFRLAIVGALRSDPDIMMIGEMRDQASTSLAFQAAMTGHQVWTTLHANDALAILDRLRDLNVDDYKLTDATLVTGLVSQRLVRKVCPHCSMSPDEAMRRGVVRAQDVEEVAWITAAGGKVRFANPEGCDHCQDGFSGREIIAETLVPDHDLLKLYMEGRKREAHGYWMEVLGGMTMPEHGVVKIFQGISDPRDIWEKVGEMSPLPEDRLSKILGMAV